ncbi:MAG: 3-methyl-2-oxobutanoate hydroxymethyltransferase [Candidatus Omnitrophica bacterium]|nr:3-methyl-2-oxobutanoate hydroxymethyltransferase [Candidatus Omnitrophota bacterium]
MLQVFITTALLPDSYAQDYLAPSTVFGHRGSAVDQLKTLADMSREEGRVSGKLEKAANGLMLEAAYKYEGEELTREELDKARGAHAFISRHVKDEAAEAERDDSEGVASSGDGLSDPSQTPDYHLSGPGTYFGKGDVREQLVDPYLDRVVKDPATIVIREGQVVHGPLGKVERGRYEAKFRDLEKFLGSSLKGVDFIIVDSEKAKGDYVRSSGKGRRYVPANDGDRGAIPVTRDYYHLLEKPEDGYGEHDFLITQARRHAQTGREQVFLSRRLFEDIPAFSLVRHIIRSAYHHALIRRPVPSYRTESVVRLLDGWTQFRMDERRRRPNVIRAIENEIDRFEDIIFVFLGERPRTQAERREIIARNEDRIAEARAFAGRLMTTNTWVGELNEPLGHLGTPLIDVDTGKETGEVVYLVENREPGKATRTQLLYRRGGEGPLIQIMRDNWFLHGGEFDPQKRYGYSQPEIYALKERILASPLFMPRPEQKGTPAHQRILRRRVARADWWGDVSESLSGEISRLDKKIEGERFGAHAVYVFGERLTRRTTSGVQGLGFVEVDLAKGSRELVLFDAARLDTIEQTSFPIRALDYVLDQFKAAETLVVRPRRGLEVLQGAVDELVRSGRLAPEYEKREAKAKLVRYKIVKEVPVPAAIFTRIARRIETMIGRYVILVGGGTGAGKTRGTSEIEAIEEELKNRHLPRAHNVTKVDITDYIRKKAERDGLYFRGRPDNGSPRAFYIDLLVEQIQTLLEGRAVHLPARGQGIVNTSGENRASFGQDDILVILGIYSMLEDVLWAINEVNEAPKDLEFESLAPQLIEAPYIDEKPLDDGRFLNVLRVFLDVDPDIRLLRKIGRDYREREASPLDSIRRWGYIRLIEDDHILPQARHAEFIIENVRENELEILAQDSEEGALRYLRVAYEEALEEAGGNPDRVDAWDIGNIRRLYDVLGVNFEGDIGEPSKLPRHLRDGLARGDGIQTALPDLGHPSPKELAARTKSVRRLLDETGIKLDQAVREKLESSLAQRYLGVVVGEDILREFLAEFKTRADREKWVVNLFSIESFLQNRILSYYLEHADEILRGQGDRGIVASIDVYLLPKTYTANRRLDRKKLIRRMVFLNVMSMASTGDKRLGSISCQGLAQLVFPSTNEHVYGPALEVMVEMLAAFNNTQRVQFWEGFKPLLQDAAELPRFGRALMRLAPRIVRGEIERVSRTMLSQADFLEGYRHTLEYVAALSTPVRDEMIEHAVTLAQSKDQDQAVIEFLRQTVKDLEKIGPVTPKLLQQMKRRGERITAVTVSGERDGRSVDEKGMPVALVADSEVAFEEQLTSSKDVTIRMMLPRVKESSRGIKRALLVADMPYGTYQTGPQALKNAQLFIENGARAVEIEGGREAVSAIGAVVEAGIPVMGHIGFTPHTKSEARIYGATPQERSELLLDALALEKAGAFALVLERVHPDTVRAIRGAVSVPLLGVASGNYIDGQVIRLLDLQAVRGDGVEEPGQGIQEAEFFERLAKSRGSWLPEPVKRQDGTVERVDDRHRVIWATVPHREGPLEVIFVREEKDPDGRTVLVYEVWQGGRRIDLLSEEGLRREFRWGVVRSEFGEAQEVFMHPIKLEEDARHMGIGFALVQWSSNRAFEIGAPRFTASALFNPNMQPLLARVLEPGSVNITVVREDWKKPLTVATPEEFWIAVGEVRVEGGYGVHFEVDKASPGGLKVTTNVPGLHDAENRPISFMDGERLRSTVEVDGYALRVLDPVEKDESGRPRYHSTRYSEGVLVYFSGRPVRVIRQRIFNAASNKIWTPVAAAAIKWVAGRTELGAVPLVPPWASARQAKLILREEVIHFQEAMDQVVARIKDHRHEGEPFHWLRELARDAMSRIRSDSQERVLRMLDELRDATTRQLQIARVPAHWIFRSLVRRRLEGGLRAQDPEVAQALEEIANEVTERILHRFDLAEPGASEKEVGEAVTTEIRRAERVFAEMRRRSEKAAEEAKIRGDSTEAFYIGMTGNYLDDIEKVLKTLVRTEKKRANYLLDVFFEPSRLVQVPEAEVKTLSETQQVLRDFHIKKQASAMSQAAPDIEFLLTTLVMRMAGSTSLSYKGISKDELKISVEDEVVRFEEAYQPIQKIVSEGLAGREWADFEGSIASEWKALLGPDLEKIFAQVSRGEEGSVVKFALEAPGRILERIRGTDSSTAEQAMYDVVEEWLGGGSRNAEEVAAVETIARFLMYQMEAIPSRDPAWLREPRIMVVDGLFDVRAADEKIGAYNVVGFAFTEGTSKSHVSDVLAGRNIPVMTGIPKELVALIQGGERVILDPIRGEIVLNPDDEGGEMKRRSNPELLRRAWETRFDPVVTQDGKTFRVYANVNGLENIQDLKECGAEGVGLVRTEYWYQNPVKRRTEEELEKGFLELADAVPGPVTIRLLDRATDKATPALKSEKALYGLRYLLDDPEGQEVAREEMRAAVRANLRSARKNIRIMVPMVATQEDGERIQSVWKSVIVGLRDKGALSEDDVVPPFGYMIELRSAVALVKTLARQADFFSIGQNDLVKSWFNVSRDEPLHRRYFDLLHPEILEADSEIAGSKEDCSLCGASARDPEFSLFQAVLKSQGVNLDSSVAVPGVPITKFALRSMHTGEAARLFERWLSEEKDPAELTRLAREAADRFIAAALGKEPAGEGAPEGEGDGVAGDGVAEWSGKARGDAVYDPVRNSVRFERTGDKTWIETDRSELIGKTFVTVGMEHLNPHFKYIDAVTANAKGGLAAHALAKLQGWSEIGLSKNGSYGIFPLYASPDLRQEDRKPLIHTVSYVGEPVEQVIDVNGKPLFIKVYGAGVGGNFRENIPYNVGVMYTRIAGTDVFYLYNGSVFNYLYDAPLLKVHQNRQNRFNQEAIFAKAAHLLMKILAKEDPHIVDPKFKRSLPALLHFNEAHTAPLAEMVSQDPEMSGVALVGTNHTIVDAGLERYELDKLWWGFKRAFFVLGTAEEHHYKYIVGDRIDFSKPFTTLLHKINGVSEEHGGLTRELYRRALGVDVDVASVLNGVSDFRRIPQLVQMEREGKEITPQVLLNLHKQAKREAVEDIFRRTGVRLDVNEPIVGLVRRITPYKGQYDILRWLVDVMTAPRDQTFTPDSLWRVWSEKTIGRELDNPSSNLHAIGKTVQHHLFKDRQEIRGLGLQVVVGGPEYEESWVRIFKSWSREGSHLYGRFVYVPQADHKLLVTQATGFEVTAETPWPKQEAAGTSGDDSSGNGHISVASAPGTVERAINELEYPGEGTAYTLDGARLYETPADFLSKAPADFFGVFEDTSNKWYGHLEVAAQGVSETETDYAMLVWRSYLGFHGLLEGTKAATAERMERDYVDRVYLPALKEVERLKGVPGSQGDGVQEDGIKSALTVPLHELNERLTREIEGVKGDGVDSILAEPLHDLRARLEQELQGVPDASPAAEQNDNVARQKLGSWLRRIWLRESRWIWRQNSHLPIRVRMALATELLDRLFGAIYEATQKRFGEKASEMAIVARGSYARSEIMPGSDIDVRLLVPHIDVEDLKRVEEEGGLPEKHLDCHFFAGVMNSSFPKAALLFSTVDDVVPWAGDDAKQQDNGYLEACLVTGSRALWQRWRSGTVEALQSRDTWKLHVRGVRSSWDERYRKARFLEGLHLRQPDLKDGLGGLRDYHYAYWLGLGALVFHANDLGSLAEKEVIRDEEVWRFLIDRSVVRSSEVDKVKEAYLVLLRIRAVLNQIHPDSTIMNVVDYEWVARQLGYRDGPRVDVERFLRDFRKSQETVFHFAYRVVRLIGEMADPPHVVTENRVGVPKGIKSVQVDGSLLSFGHGVRTMRQTVLEIDEKIEGPRDIAVTLFDALRYVSRHPTAVLNGAFVDALESQIAAGGPDKARLQREFGKFLDFTEGPISYGLRNLRFLRISEDPGGMLADILPFNHDLVYPMRLEPPHRLTLDMYLLRNLDVAEALLFERPDLAMGSEGAQMEGFGDLQSSLWPVLDYIWDRELVRALRAALLLQALNPPESERRRRGLREEDIEKSVVESLKNWGIIEDNQSPMSREAELALWLIKNQFSLIESLRRGVQYVPSEMASVLEKELEGDPDRFSLLVAFTLIKLAVLQPTNLEQRLRDMAPIFNIDPVQIADREQVKQFIEEANEKIIAQHRAELKQFEKSEETVWVKGMGDMRKVDREHTVEILISYKLPGGQDRPGILADIAAAFLSAGLNVEGGTAGLGPGGKILDRFVVRPVWGFRGRTWQGILNELKTALSSLLNGEVNREELIKSIRADDKTAKLIASGRLPRPRSDIPTDVRIEGVKEGERALTELRSETADSMGLFFMSADLLDLHKINVHCMVIDNEGDDPQLQKAIQHFEMTKGDYPLDRKERSNIHDILEHVLAQKDYIDIWMWQSPESEAEELAAEGPLTPEGDGVGVDAEKVLGDLRDELNFPEGDGYAVVQPMASVLDARPARFADSRHVSRLTIERVMDAASAQAQSDRHFDILIDAVDEDGVEAANEFAPFLEQLSQKIATVGGPESGLRIILATGDNVEGRLDPIFDRLDVMRFPARYRPGDMISVRAVEVYLEQKYNVRIAIDHLLLRLKEHQARWDAPGIVPTVLEIIRDLKDLENPELWQDPHKLPTLYFAMRSHEEAA